MVGLELDACRWLLAPLRGMRELLGPKMAEKPTWKTETVHTGVIK